MVGNYHKASSQISITVQKGRHFHPFLLPSILYSYHKITLSLFIPFQKHWSYSSQKHFHHSLLSLHQYHHTYQKQLYHYVESSFIVTSHHSRQSPLSATSNTCIKAQSSSLSPHFAAAYYLNIHTLSTPPQSPTCLSVRLYTSTVHLLH